MVTRWTFEDAVLAETYTFEVNPNAGGSLQYAKQVQYQNTSAPDGKTVIFEGRDEPKTLSWSGVILSQDQLETFQDWFDKRRQIELTDDIGRVFTIYITSFKPERVRVSTNLWKHNYTMEATVLDWP